MALRWYSVVVDCHDVRAQASWWAAALDWQLDYEADDEAVIVSKHARSKAEQIPVLERGPELVFVSVPDGKTVKNRLHLDLAAPAGDSQADEVARLIALGATQISVGQRDVGWVVLADPEGNEFCVLSSRD